jgi:hypothetical protein
VRPLLTPIGGSKKLTLVQCSACGTLVGILNPATGPQIEALTDCLSFRNDELNLAMLALALLPVSL